MSKMTTAQILKWSTHLEVSYLIMKIAKSITDLGIIMFFFENCLHTLITKFNILKKLEDKEELGKSKLFNRQGRDESTGQESCHKIFLLLPKKPKKSIQALQENFFKPQIQAYIGASIPNFKISTPFFCCALFFEEYLNPNLGKDKQSGKQTNIVFNEHNYHPNPSGISQGCILSHFYRLFKASSLSKIFVEFTLKPVRPTVFGKIFQIYGVQITGKCIENKKKRI